jgi:hypothetical protein
LSAPFSLGYGDVTESAFANSFLRIFIYEDALGRALPDPRWSQPNDQFKTEVEQLVKQAGGYRYEAELVSHNSLSRWLEERRKSAHKVIKLDPKISDQYVGQYEVEPGKVFTVTKENDRLFISDAGRTKIQAFPESEARFFFTPMETRLTFIRDSKGLVTHAEFEDDIELRGQRIRATKVK